ncbi:unnamed protein product [Miscanthus lutarioriparius]|uniref:Uncharacterized protein n=1 Tax=Miscanthus lutarioriparius TaxID=422564 RepID=A0A811NXV6_9POAL|nr:unnamed protein product [Miscanthus lutarioriparius]
MLDLEGPSEGGWGGNRQRGRETARSTGMCDEGLLGGPSAADRRGEADGTGANTDGAGANTFSAVEQAWAAARQGRRGGGGVAEPGAKSTVDRNNGSEIQCNATYRRGSSRICNGCSAVSDRGGARCWCRREGVAAWVAVTARRGRAQMWAGEGAVIPFLPGLR